MQAAPPPSPFLKWAGGKRQLLPHILAALPARVETYFEPFVGGGAVFFALAAERRFRRAVLGDANGELVRCYRAIQRDVEGVVRALQAHRYEEAYYYALRDLDPEALPEDARAARLIYLNRCGYNGLYRVNSKGLFNVPFGRHVNPVICDEVGLRAVSAALRGVKLINQDFEETLRAAKDVDFAYIDPPYVPVSATSYFTAYAKAGFGPAEQQRLANCLVDLGRRRVPALLSNSDCRATRRLYTRALIRKVSVRRAINSVVSSRGPVGELLVKSYAYPEIGVLRSEDGQRRRSAKRA